VRVEHLGPLFAKSQAVFEIGGLRVGGQPGENPALLIGSVFYLGDKALIDPARGVVDKERVRREVEEARSLVEGCGLNFALDVIIPSAEAVSNILTFIGELGVVIFIDAPSPEIRAKAYAVARELGLERVSVANGIYTNSTPEELEALRESGIEAAVLMGFDPSNPASSIRPEDRVKLVRERLLSMAEKAGVTKILLDMVVLDPASIALSAVAVALAKEEFGLPAGCAPANALGGVTAKRLGVEEATAIHASTAAFLRAYGADFIFYGPVGRAKYVAPAVAMVDSYLGYLARLRGARVLDKHPLRAYLRRIQQIFTTTR
jgi:tetrahydromethanopterin S-methyltransferase subunit H